MAVVCCFALVLAGLASPSPAYGADRPTQDGEVVVFGNLHAHSQLSDDIGNGTDMLPSAAFAYAHQQGVDFLAITDHHQATDGAKPLRLGLSEYKDKLYDVALSTVAIICTVAGGHVGGKHANSSGNTHREMSADAYDCYLDLLNMGFHISPAGEQDTHGPNWGVVTAARTAVWADAVTLPDLLSALKANRVYATEDDELVVSYQVEYQGHTYWMGETVPLGQDEADVVVLIKVWQSPRSDPQLADEGPYTVQIISDADGVGGREAAVWGEPIVDVPSAELKRIPLRVVPGEYIFLRVSEQNGKDNPVGDGDDEINNETGESGPDGKRDDMSDSAWTSPIWFSGGESYVWSKNSDVYHDADCWAAKRIGEANRRTGPAPQGKRKHDCHP